MQTLAHLDPTPFMPPAHRPTARRSTLAGALRRLARSRRTAEVA